MDLNFWNIRRCIPEDSGVECCREGSESGILVLPPILDLSEGPAGLSSTFLGGSCSLPVSVTDVFLLSMELFDDLRELLGSGFSVVA
jgi:hypothetical protein